MLYSTASLKTFYQKTYLFTFLSVFTPIILHEYIPEIPAFFVVIEILFTLNHVISFSERVFNQIHPEKGQSRPRC